MKLHALEQGARFKLAGDPESPVFTFIGATQDMMVLCTYDGGIKQYMPGCTPVLRTDK